MRTVSAHNIFPNTPAMLCPAQISYHPRFRQRTGRGKENRMTCFISPEFIQAHWFGSFHCLDFNLVESPPDWQGQDHTALSGLGTFF